MQLSAFEGSRYHARLLELLDDPECTVIANDATVAIFSPVAGALGVIKLHLLLGDLPDLRPARLIVAEVPDDSPFQEMTAALLAKDFREEGHIHDFVADGVALRILTWRPPPVAGSAPGRH